VRYATPDDESVLAQFRCSRGVPVEDEIEAFIRRDALARFFSGSREEVQPRLILALGPDDVLLGLAGHEARDIKVDGDEAVGSFIVVVAQALVTRGRRLPDGTRLSDLLFRLAVTDSWRLRRSHEFVARAHVDNLPGLDLCERAGLVSQTGALDHSYVWITGSLEPPEGLEQWLPPA
jgi:hypothetical protein